MSQAPSIAPPPPRRRRRLLTAFAILVIAVAGLAIGYWFLLAEEREYQELFAETDRLDPGWRFADIEAARPQVPDELNSVLHIDKVHRALGSSSGASWKLLKELAGLAPDKPLQPDQVLEFRQAMQTVGNGRMEAFRLKDMPEGRYPPAFDSSRRNPVWSATDANRLLDVGRFLHMTALLAIHDGDQPATWDALRAGFNSARAVGDEPNVMGQLVYEANTDLTLRALNRALAQNDWTPAELRSLQQLLEREMADPHLLRGTRGERALKIEMHEAAADGRLPPLPVKRPSWRAWLPRRFLDGQTQSKLKLLRALNAQVAVARLPVEQQFAAGLKLADAQQADEDTRDVSSGFRTMLIMLVGCQARLRCALLATAALRFHQEHGAWPASAAILAQRRDLKEVPLDPYDGQPLRFQRLPDGVVCYSVGPRQLDNGGLADNGVGSGFRLYDPAARPAR